MLHYYRCRVCLATMTAEEKVFAECGACGAQLWYLGPVTDAGRWQRVTYRPKCDGRCISARGPKCDCECRGENHGRGLLVPVIRDGGKVRLVPADDAARQRAEEYRAALREVYNVLDLLFGEQHQRFREGRWVPSSAAWHELRRTYRELEQIAGLVTHRTRIQRLRELADRLRRMKATA